MGIYDRDYMRAPLRRQNRFTGWRISAKNKKAIFLASAAAILIAAIALPSYLPFAVFENRSELTNYGSSVLTITSIALYDKAPATYKVYTKVDYGFPLMSWFYFPWLFGSFGPSSNTLKYEAKAHFTEDRELVLEILKGSPTYEAEKMAKSFGGGASFADELVPDLKTFRLERSSLVDNSGARYKKKWGAFYDLVNQLRAIVPSVKKLFTPSG